MSLNILAFQSQLCQHSFQFISLTEPDVSGFRGKYRFINEATKKELYTWLHQFVESFIFYIVHSPMLSFCEPYVKIKMYLEQIKSLMTQKKSPTLFLLLWFYERVETIHKQTRKHLQSIKLKTERLPGLLMISTYFLLNV